MIRPARWAVFIACLPACAPAPSDGIADAAVDVAADAPVIHVPPYCASDPRTQPYAAGMQAHDATSARTVTLETVDPAPPLRDNYVWTVQVTDPGGAGVPGLAMTVRPWMPDHGHGASVVPTVTDLGAGRYRIDNLDLFMEGVWTVTFRSGTPPGAVDAGGEAGVTDMDASTGDTAVFTVCVGGT